MKDKSAQNATYNGTSQTNRASFGQTNFQNGLLGLQSETTGSVTTSYVHLPSGANQTIMQLIGSTPYYYLTDIHGSTIAMTDKDGVVMNSYSYDPYGRQVTKTGTTANAIRYANGYQDSSTGLYKYGARYYNVVEGRWTQTDPSGQDAHYVYAGNNPINGADPSGLAYGAVGIEACFAGIFCGSAGLGDTGTELHPYVGLGLGIGGGVNAGVYASSGSGSSGWSDVASCALGVAGGGASFSASGELSGFGSAYMIPLNSSCSIQALYTF